MGPGLGCNLNFRGDSSYPHHGHTPKPLHGIADLGSRDDSRLELLLVRRKVHWQNYVADGAKLEQPQLWLRAKLH